VTFEFDDLAINNGVQAGHVRIGYSTSDSSIVIARRIRDAINSASVQSLVAVTAALADGTATGTASTSSRINLFGKASLSFEGGVKARQVFAVEPNDVIANVTPTGIGTENVVYFAGSGTVGDNPNLAEPTEDLDLFEVSMTAGQTVTIQIDTIQIGRRWTRSSCCTTRTVPIGTRRQVTYMATSSPSALAPSISRRGRPAITTWGSAAIPTSSRISSMADLTTRT